MSDSTTTRPDNRTSADILNDVLKNIEDLIRSEMRLAKVEIQQEAKKTGIAVGVLTAGGIVALYGFAFLLVAIYLGFSYVIWPWLSAVVVGGFLVLFGGAVAGFGFRKLNRVHLKPEQTIGTLREDAEWIRKRTL